MRRVARTCKAIALPRLNPPSVDEIGVCDSVSVEEVGSTKCTIFKQEKEGSRVATIIVRGSTNNVLEDVERAVDDAVHVYRNMARVRPFSPYFPLYLFSSPSVFTLLCLFFAIESLSSLPRRKGRREGKKKD